MNDVLPLIRKEVPGHRNITLSTSTSTKMESHMEFPLRRPCLSTLATLDHPDKRRNKRPGTMEDQPSPSGTRAQKEQKRLKSLPGTPSTCGEGLLAAVRSPHQQLRPFCAGLQRPAQLSEDARAKAEVPGHREAPLALQVRLSRAHIVGP